MQLRFLVIVALLLLSTFVAARPRTTKNNQDLDGIGADLEDFIKHKDATQSFQGYNRRVNAGDLTRSPSSGKNKSTLDRISDFFKKVLGS